jgi:hypothetical protein
MFLALAVCGHASAAPLPAFEMCIDNCIIERRLCEDAAFRRHDPAGIRACGDRANRCMAACEGLPCRDGCDAARTNCLNRVRDNPWYSPSRRIQARQRCRDIHARCRNAC